MSDTLLHNHSDSLRPPLTTLIYRILQHLNRDTIPPDTLPSRPDLLLECEIAIQLQIQRVVLSDLGVRRLVDDLPTHVKLRALRVKVQALHADLERQVHSC